MTGWRNDASCREIPNADLVFFPASRAGGATAAAKKICDRCPVRLPCGVEGADEPFGVWGGANESRDELLRGRDRGRRARRQRASGRPLEQAGQGVDVGFDGRTFIPQYLPV